MVAFGGISSIGGIRIRGTSTASRSAASVAARLKDDAAASQFDHSWHGKSSSIGNALQYILKIGWIFGFSIGISGDGELDDLRVTSLFFNKKCFQWLLFLYFRRDLYEPTRCQTQSSTKCSFRLAETEIAAPRSLTAN